jgi:prolipoprotein diacylglyceryltransferase
VRPHVVAWLDRLLPHDVAAALAPSWFTCVGIAGLVTLLLLLRAGRRAGIPAPVIASIVLACYVAAVGAGIVVPVAIDLIAGIYATGEVRIHWAGMTSFWGYLAGAVAVAIVARRHAVPLAALGDLAAAPLGVALALARTGCFLAGCDYGKVTAVPWGVRFPSGSSAWRDHVHAGLVAPDRGASLAVHPTQLYEAALGVVMALAAIALARTAWAKAPAGRSSGGSGRVFVAIAAIYAVGRIGIETLRADLGRGIHAGLSSGQIFCGALLIAIAIGLIARRHAVAAAVTALVLVAFAAPQPAHAQPRDDAPPVGPAPPPTPMPAPMPADPYAGPPAPPSAATPLPPPMGGPPPARVSPLAHLEVAAFVGYAMPMNRPSDQVPSLAGPSLSIGYDLGLAGVWLDVDSLGNSDASHGTLLLAASYLAPVAPKLHLGGRFGFGTTLVNFDEPAFRDVAGTTIRFEALAEYELAPHWVLALRPLSIDVLDADDLGGPITSYQVRIGVAYRFAPRARRHR